MAYDRWWYWCGKCGKWATVLREHTSSVVYAPPIVNCEYCGNDLTKKEPPKEVSGDA